MYGDDYQCAPGKLSWFGSGAGAYMAANPWPRPHNIYSIAIHELGLLAAVPAGVLAWALWTRRLAIAPVAGLLVMGILDDTPLSQPEGHWITAVALVMAAAGRALRVMFPMVSVVEEFEAARALLTTVLKDHEDRGGTAPATLEVGVMLEVPALLWDLDRLFALADFASVGSNDLFQFLTAADRNNPKTDQRFEALTAANLRLLTAIAASARRAGKPVSLCGELAGTPLGAIALIGCGFRAFSMDSMRIAQIKSVIRAVDMAMVEDRISNLAKRAGGSVRNDIADLARAWDIALT